VRELAQLFAREAAGVAALMQPTRRLERAAAHAPTHAIRHPPTHPLTHPLGRADADALLALFERCDALRRPDRFEALLEACRFAEGEAVAVVSSRQLMRLLQAALDANTAAAAAAAAQAGAQGPQVGDAVRRARLLALESALDDTPPAPGGLPGVTR
jgi:tRNA nucleotidyltransferase (CCA-adding enzyme)